MVITMSKKNPLWSSEKNNVSSDLMEHVETMNQDSFFIRQEGIEMRTIMLSIFLEWNNGDPALKLRPDWMNKAVNCLNIIFRCG